MEPSAGAFLLTHPQLLLAHPQLLLAALAAMGVSVLALVALYVRERLARRRLAARLSTVRAKLDDIDAGALPGVLNRARFDRALEEAVHRADAGGAPLSVLFVNIDNFVTVNESCGYGCGDHVIEQAAERLVATVGPAAPIARLGGDEFVVLVACPLDAARSLAADLVRLLARPYIAGGRRDLVLSCSIGIAAYPEHASKSRLLGHANSAMRQVKLAGGGDYMVFEPRMAVDLREQAELLHDLRSAVAKGELELYYQPKIDSASLQITSVEALLRWHHPRRGMVSPALFIPIAERFGLIGAIGDWVIEDACRQAAAWRDQGLHMRVAINISPYQMRQDDLADGIVEALRRHGLAPARFTCEITESVAMEDTKVTQRTFARLGEAGLHVSIDDFGVGQASLSYLRRLPATELKIDGSFVRDLETSADARSIVDAVVRLAHALELRVVAEGVETERQCELLVQMGCDELQGYLFARPMSAAALGVWAMAEETGAPERFRPSLFNDLANC